MITNAKKKKKSYSHISKNVKKYTSITKPIDGQIM
jgi:hypothetical protein